MSLAEELKRLLEGGAFDERFHRVYGGGAEVWKLRGRYAGLADSFAALYGKGREIRLFSAPGRTELGGNHTDHNCGRVLAASVDLDAAGIASKNGESIVRIKSEGYGMDVADLRDLRPRAEETGHSPALVRGMIRGFSEFGFKVGGFDAATASEVFSGSGLSSSAAYEVLVGTMLNHLYNGGRIDAVTLARIGQYAENEYFGKPCGLMDQTVCSVGGLLLIDFRDPQKPAVEKVDFDFAGCGHSLCIVHTGGGHSDLTDEYASIPGEMKRVASRFGKSALREVDETDFREVLGELRKDVGDRAVLRALHFFSENRRVLQEAQALRRNDFEAFKVCISESGASSYMYNQNVYVGGEMKNQPLALALALSEDLLRGRGAWRVHGGGFAGTIQAFVPDGMLREYRAKLEAVFGQGACRVLHVRPVGGTEI